LFSSLNMQNNENKTKQIAEEAGDNGLRGLRTYQKDLASATKKNKPLPKSTGGAPIPPKPPRSIENDIKIKLVKTPPPKPSTLEREVSEARMLRQENKIREEEEKKLKEETEKRKIAEEKERVRVKMEEEERRRKAVLEEELQKKEAVRKRGEEKIRLEGQLEELNARESVLEREKEPLLIKKVELEKKLAPIIEREEVVEKSIEKIEREESVAVDSNMRRSIEQKRWGVEEERRSIEKEKWEIEKSIENVLASIKAKEVSLQSLIEQKNTANNRLEEINKEVEKKEIQQKLIGISRIKEKFELDWISLTDKKATLDESIKTSLEREGGLVNEKKVLEEKERTTLSTQERREIEQKRWGVEDARKTIEEKRWGLEKELDEINQNIEILKPKYQAALAEEEAMQKKLTEFV